MTVITQFQQLAVQVTTHPAEVLKLEWRGGDSAASTGLFVQVWDTETGPGAANATLKKAFPMVGGAYDYKEFKPGEGEMEFNRAVWVGVSTTEATYTAAAGNNLMAMVSVELRRAEQPSGTTYVGDFTTAVRSLAVWSEASGLAAPKKLVSVEIDGTNLNAADKWLMIFAKGVPLTGDTPMLVRSIVPGQIYTGQNAFEFGDHGIDILQNIAGRYVYGCTVAISSTPGTLTAAVGTATLYAEYAINP